MFNFFEQAVHKVSQSVEYDDRVDTITEIFSSQYVEGKLEESLSTLLNNLSLVVTDNIDRLGDDLSTSWTNAVLNFRDELESAGFDVADVDFEDLASRAKVYYIEKLKEDLQNYFNQLLVDSKDSQAANAVLEEVLYSTVEGYAF